MNIVSIVTSFLTPAVVGRIATALGINPTVAQMAVTAALPAILGAIAGKAAQPSGLGALTGLLGQQNPAMLANLGSIIGGSEQASLVTAGKNALGTLLGGPSTSALTAAVGKFAGVPESASSSLLGMLAPVALGTLAQQQKASGLDANGLASLLASQKDNIAAAMPKGFGDLLKGTGLLDGVIPSASAPSASQPPRAPAAARSATATTPPAPSSLMRYLPLLGALAVALVGYSFWQSTRGPAVPAVSKIVYNNVDISGKATSIYENLKSNIAGIKDEASARTMLPKLQDSLTSLGEMRDIQQKLPADSRQGLAKLFATLLPGLEGLIASALKTPGAEAIIKPVLEQVLERMKALAKV